MANAAIDLTRFRWADWADDPYPLYSALRDEQPVYFDEPNDAHVLTRYEDVSLVLRDHRRFSSVPLTQLTGEIEALRPIRDHDPPCHTARRRLVAPLFASGQMRRRVPFFQQVSREILSGIETQDEVEVSSEIAAPLAGRVTCDLLGVPYEFHDRFRELTQERLVLLDVSYGLVGESRYGRTIDDVRSDLWDFIGPIADERRVHPREDAISLLAQAQDRDSEDPITDGLFTDLLLHLLAGGFETTMHLVENLLSLFADRQDLWKRLREERGLIDVAVEEMLRWDSPFQTSRRRAVEDTIIRDTSILKNSTVFVILGSANRDERMFPDPDQYHLDRDLSRILAFGFGIHYCPGAPVTRYEVRALLEEMLDRYVSLERTGPSERRQQEGPMPTPEAMRGLRRVPIRLHRE
jgi:cytochrome P450